MATTIPTKMRAVYYSEVLLIILVSRASLIVSIRCSRESLTSVKSMSPHLEMTKCSSKVNRIVLGPRKASRVTSVLMIFLTSSGMRQVYLNFPRYATPDLLM